MFFALHVIRFIVVRTVMGCAIIDIRQKGDYYINKILRLFIF